MSYDAPGTASSGILKTTVAKTVSPYRTDDPFPTHIRRRTK